MSSPNDFLPPMVDRILVYADLALNKYVDRFRKGVLIPANRYQSPVVPLESGNWRLF